MLQMERYDDIVKKIKLAIENCEKIEDDLRDTYIPAIQLDTDEFDGEFDKYVDENHEENDFSIFGRSYSPSQILKKVDPDARRILLSHYVDDLPKSRHPQYNDFLEYIEFFENERDDLEFCLDELEDSKDDIQDYDEQEMEEFREENALDELKKAISKYNDITEKINHNKSTLISLLVDCCSTSVIPNQL